MCDGSHGGESAPGRQRIYRWGHADQPRTARPCRRRHPGDRSLEVGGRRAHKRAVETVHPSPLHWRHRGVGPGRECCRSRDRLAGHRRQSDDASVRRSGLVAGQHSGRFRFRRAVGVGYRPSLRLPNLVRRHRRRRSRASGPQVCPPAGRCARHVGVARRRRIDLDRRRMARAVDSRRDHLRASRRNLHSHRDTRRRHRQTRPPRRPRRRLRRTHAGQCVQRRRRMGIRRRRLVRGPGILWRSRCTRAVRRRMPCTRDRSRARRRLQPPRTVGKLSARVRAVPQRRRHLVGRRTQPSRTGLRHRA